MILEAIILAGGMGTRLRSAVPDRPKALAPVAGRPFLGHVVDSLRRQGVQKFVFSIGYLADQVEEFLEMSYPTLDYRCVVEKEPLGTGGAIMLALSVCETENVLVTNGDTLFKADIARLQTMHQLHKAECTLALKPMQNFDRYGTVTLSDDGRVLSFEEKQPCIQGLINGGLYLINKAGFTKHSFPRKFSFEEDYLKKLVGSANMFGVVDDAYFIDIGIPYDFIKAGKDLAPASLNYDQIDNNWTLFLDRDGVINDERLNEYVLHWKEFVFSKDVLKTFSKLNAKFGRLILVTNQRGVSKGLMTERDLHNIHSEMRTEIEAAGGRLDAIYYALDSSNKGWLRKPNPGMALQAVQDFPEIDLSKSIMVGNKLSDMKFGRAAGMFTVYVATTNPEQEFPHPDIDRYYPDLTAFAAELES